jgi:hypothetical protein
MTAAGPFARLASEWVAATEFQSSATAVATHPAGRQIIGLGEAAIPLILAELAANPAPRWFPLLAELAGELPAGLRAAAEGNVVQVAHAWIEWGRTRISGGA